MTPKIVLRCPETAAQTVDGPLHRFQCRLPIDHPGKHEACQLCIDIYTKHRGFGPPHNASPRCESGRDTHCACDICF